VFEQYDNTQVTIESDVVEHSCIECDIAIYAGISSGY
jgi:hypothetical protein